MKKSLILIVMLVVQSLICLTFACDIVPGEQSSKAAQFISSEHCADSNATHSTQSSHVECNQCNFCLHLVVTFLNVDINFVASEISSQQFSIHELYHQPFIYQSKKPPIKS